MEETIDYFAYNNPFIRIKTFFSLKARKKMYKRFIELCCPQDDSEILDLGATPDTKLADSNFLEKMYPNKEHITVASIEDCSALVKRHGLREYVKNEPHSKLPFSDGQFDIVFCSAVLEHVGTRLDQKFFLKECLRVGKKVFLTTPNRGFPIEMHTLVPFIHWLPWSWFQKLVMPIQGGFWSDINNLNLLNKKNIEDMGLGVEVSYIYTIGLKSNLVVIKI